MILPMEVKGRGVETGQIGEGRLLMTLANLVAEFSTGKVKKEAVLCFLQLECFRFDSLLLLGLLPLPELLPS